MLLNPFIGTVGVGSGGGVTYFFEERFEGTGYDSSNANGWTEGGTGTVDEDYTGVILEGTQSLRFVASAQQPTTTAVFDSDQDELWGFFRIRIVTSVSATHRIFIIRNTGGTPVFNLQALTDNRITQSNGTVGTTTTDAMTTGSDYNCWWHWLKGTGTDGVSSFGFSASGTEVTAGTSYASTLSGNSVTDAHDIVLGAQATNHTFEFVIDQILISTTGTIGNSPA